MLAVFGASGNIGGKLSNFLADAGVKFKVIGRREQGLVDYAERGIQTVIGDPENEDFLTDAFLGVDAAFVMTPADYTAENLRGHFNNLGQKIAGALQEADVKYIVNLSCLGAHIPDKSGPVKGLYDQELRLNTLKGVNVIHLRPAYLMENLLGNELIKFSGHKIISPINGDVKIEIVASEDVAKFARNFLIERNFNDKSAFEIFGNDRLSLKEAAKIIGEATNNPDLSYEHRPYGKVFEDLQDEGMSEDSAHCLIEFARAINEGLLFGSHKGRNDRNTGDTLFNEWAKSFSAK